MVGRRGNRIVPILMLVHIHYFFVVHGLVQNFKPSTFFSSGTLSTIMLDYYI